ncbi:MAG: hypothetical protein LBB25_01165 [Holosporaceae bacterium]|nr:hypothetical protein [Holosporaceae bacterium]
MKEASFPQKPHRVWDVDTFQSTLLEGTRLHPFYFALLPESDFLQARAVVATISETLKEENRRIEMSHQVVEESLKNYREYFPKSSKELEPETKTVTEANAWEVSEIFQFKK